MKIRPTVALKVEYSKRSAHYDALERKYSMISTKSSFEYLKHVSYMSDLSKTDTSFINSCNAWVIFIFPMNIFFLHSHIDRSINSSPHSMGLYKVIAIEGGLNWFEILIELRLCDYSFILYNVWGFLPWGYMHNQKS